MQLITLLTALLLPKNRVTQHFIHNNLVHPPSQHCIVLRLSHNTHNCFEPKFFCNVFGAAQVNMRQDSRRPEASLFSKEVHFVVPGTQV